MIISVITNKTNHTFPNFEIGFPYTYYYQFQVKNESCIELQHGTYKTGIIYNYLLGLILFIVLKFKQLKK